MKKLVILVVVAVVAMFCEAKPRRSTMPVDRNGWRCEGDCDENTPCKFCNPPPKAKRSTAKKSATKRRGARRRSRKSVKTPEVAL